MFASPAVSPPILAPGLLPEERAAFAPSPRLASHQWAARHVRVASGPRRGERYAPDFLPYVRGIFRVLDCPSVRKCILAAGSQSGKTLAVHAWLMADRARGGGPAGVCLRGEDVCKRLFADRIIPQIRGCAPLLRQLDPDRHAITATEVAWADGVVWHGLWAGSEASVSSLSLERLILDEVDDYPDGGVAATIEERVTAYPWTSKIIWLTKIRGHAGESLAEEALRHGVEAVLHYQARCPACQALQQMDFGRLRVPGEERDPRQVRARHLARHACQACNYLWGEEARRRALQAGRWAAYADGLGADGGGDARTLEEAAAATPLAEVLAGRPLSVGLRLTALEQPLVSLSTLWAEEREAQGDPHRLRNFHNNRRCQTYSREILTLREEDLGRLEDPGLPEGHVPAAAQLLTLAADMQGAHFVWDVWAHRWEPVDGVTRHWAWLVQAGVCLTWADLKSLIFDRRWPGVDGREHLVARAALDTGGGQAQGAAVSRTEEAYTWLAGLRPGLVWGCKGVGSVGDRYMVKPSAITKLPSTGRFVRAGLFRQLTNVDAFKRQLHFLLQEEDCFLRFHAGTPPSYPRQLLGEKLVVDRRGRERWVVTGPNHHLDTAVLHLAMGNIQWHPPLDQLAMARERRERRAREARQAGAGQTRAAGGGPGMMF